MPDFSSQTADFISELDAAVEAHMGWTRSVLRCAVLRTSPSEDVVAPLAHTLCSFGRWFGSNRKHFQKLDAPSTRGLDAVHQAMHDAIRSICADLLAGRPGQGADLEAFERTQSELIKLLAEFKTHFLAIATRHDPLTGLPLRYGIEDEFTQVQKNCRRHKTQLYVGIIDADHFKRVNDAYGHSVGDIALCHLADTLRRIVRPNEPLFRFGGEEFLMLMQCRTRDAAVTAAQRIVQTVRHAPVLMAHGEPLILTITLGLARVGNDEAMADAVERADRALYAGKETGRDRYIIADEVAT